VLVISDQTSGAGVLLEQTRLRGVLRGNALGQPQIINMLPDERVKPGERVITSGGDQIYPRGLPVGVVDQVVPDTSNPPYMDILIKPAANLGHLEELLVITQAGDQMPEKEKQDLAQSAAAGAMAETQQRASDILAERLPGLTDPNALADTPGQANSVAAGTAAAVAAAAAVAPKLHPPPALHADHYSPNATAPASALTPGQAIVDPKYAPPPPTAKAVSKKPEPGDDAAGQDAAQGDAAKPAVHHPATSPAAPGAEAVPGTEGRPAVAKPKAPKATPADQPATAVPTAEPSAEPPAASGSGSPPQ
jgi:rod shape-determining protein MreC